MADYRNTYPPPSFYFQVQFGDVSDPDEKPQPPKLAADDPNADVDMRFQEVSGLSHEIGTEDVPEGGENQFTYRLPTKGKYTNLVLKRGVMVNSGLVKWINNALDLFKFKPVDITVNLLNEKGTPLVKWNFVKAYPVKWATSDLKAQENAILVETLELAYQSFSKSYVKQQT